MLAFRTNHHTKRVSQANETILWIEEPKRRLNPPLGAARARQAAFPRFAARAECAGNDGCAARRGAGETHHSELGVGLRAPGAWRKNGERRRKPT